MDRQSIGKKGEDYACQYLLQNEFSIISRNQQFNQNKRKIGEIDIVAKKENTIYIFEVKTRTSIIYGKAQESITPKKLQTLYYMTDYLTMYYKKIKLQLISIDVKNNIFDLQIIDLY